MTHWDLISTGGGWRFGRVHQMKMWTCRDHDMIFRCGLHKDYVPVHGFFVFSLWSLGTREIVERTGAGPRNQEFLKKTFSGLVVRIGSNLWALLDLSGLHRHPVWFLDSQDVSLRYLLHRHPYLRPHLRSYFICYNKS